MTAQTNSPRYDAAMTAARLVGNNFKTLRDNKRKLAVDLVAASVVEGFALQEAITAAKGQAKWAKLAADERNTLNVLFTAVRVIDGAWKTLPEDDRKAFLAGEKIFSTLAKEIKDAEKAALAKDGEGEGEGEGETPAAETPAETPADAGPSPLLQALALVRASIGQVVSDAEAEAFAALMAELAEFRAAEAARLAA